jgi:hypothetical protein
MLNVKPACLAFRSGATAARTGKAMEHANPYAPSSVLHADFKRGWLSVVHGADQCAERA